MQPNKVPPILTDKNVNYGGNLINQKYSPLATIRFSLDRGPLVSGLLTNRARVLKDLGLFDDLLLGTKDWDAIKSNEKTQGRHPPLVVVSSGRASWIQCGIEEAKKRLDVVNTIIPNPIAAFSNECDLRALNGDNLVSPPIYAPLRVNDPNRSIYIVVHFTEYQDYQEALAGCGITLVAWALGTIKKKKSLTGFGASRFAAIAFCKELRNLSENRMNSSWLIDDNVVALQNFPGLTAVEGALGNHACAGFSGATALDSRASIRDWAAAQLEKIPQALANPADSGLMQQMVLWNIDYLARHSLNFGPAYITSAEDVSLSAYLDRMHQKNQNNPSCQLYRAITVKKEQVSSNWSGEGSKKLAQLRDELIKGMVGTENANPIDGGPLLVTPATRADGQDQPLAKFVCERVLPNSPLKEAAENPTVRYKALCQAVEQITSTAIGGFRDNNMNNIPALLGDGFLSEEALNCTFKVAPRIERKAAR